MRRKSSPAGSCSLAPSRQRAGPHWPRTGEAQSKRNHNEDPQRLTGAHALSLTSMRWHGFPCGQVKRLYCVRSPPPATRGTILKYCMHAQGERGWGEGRHAGTQLNARHNGRGGTGSGPTLVIPLPSRHALHALGTLPFARHTDAAWAGAATAAQMPSASKAITARLAVRGRCAPARPPTSTGIGLSTFPPAAGGDAGAGMGAGPCRNAQPDVIDGPIFPNFRRAACEQ